ncbi:ATP-dependent helicase [Candidatus Saccharibacteria bacterium]|nr:ATP-dependent helicase [Candidatus Saccharibacteria bacterium]
MGLNTKQREAVEYLEGPLLVLAGPGTGKTQLLSEKVAYILKTTDTLPENILCVTFTESGAQNMRERLKSIIGRDGLKVNISTYHVLGQEILSEYRNYSEDYDRKLDSVIDEVTQYKIIKNIQAKLSGKDILRGDNVKDIISVISESKSASLSASDLQKIAEQNLQDSEVISKAISPLLLNIVPRQFRESYDKAYQPIYEILQNYLELDPLLPRVERSIVGLARDLKTAILEAESTEKIKPLSGWKDTYFEKDHKGNYRLKDRVANKKLLSIANIMQQYETYLHEQGLYDFDDMIQEAVRILAKDEGFRLTLSERYQFIMLDEFQDTNPSQFMIIKQLTNYEKPMIMAVGDDDQAIYEFQGALSTNLLDFQKHYSANVIALTENYRSTQEILDFSSQIIRQAPDRFADKELTAHKPAPPKSQIIRREFLSSELEYAWIASQIAELIKNGVSQSQIAVISYKTKYFLPLLPFLKSYPEIKIAYEKRDNLLEDEKIHELLTIARFVYELANERKVDTSLLEILAYPYFKLPMLEVVRLAGVAKHEHKSLYDVASASESSDITEVTTWLADLVAKSFNEPLEIFLDYLTGVTELNGYRSPFLAYYTKDGGYEAFTLYENLSALKGRLVKHFGEKPLRLRDLIEMITDYIEAEIPINVTSPYRDADESVQILSAHKAKGLEFEHVFMLSVDHVAWGKGKGNNNLLALPKNLAFIRHTGTTDGEKLRILYVALTRAKTHLYLTNSLHDFNDKSPDRLEYLEEYIQKDPDTGTESIISPFLPTKNVILDYIEGALPSSAPNTSENSNTTELIIQNRTANLQKWLHPYIELAPDMRTIYKERVQNYRMSATALTNFIDIVYAGPVQFFKSYLLQAPREPETESLIYGILIHSTFEAVTNEQLTDEQAIDYFLAELEKQDISVDTRQALREKGLADLSIALREFGKILRDGKAEVDFASEKLVVNGVPVTGKIDHIIVDDATKTIEIYDFKTAGYHKEKWQSHATLYKYMLQLEFYKMLLNNSRKYNKYKVTRAHILFVVPDRDGEVYDKIYDYSETEYQQFINLLTAVYSEIFTLNFMDDSDIFIEPDESRKLKDIQDFIALLLEKNTKK